MNLRLSGAPSNGSEARKSIPKIHHTWVPIGWLCAQPRRWSKLAFRVGDPDVTGRYTFYVFPKSTPYSNPRCPVFSANRPEAKPACARRVWPQTPRRPSLSQP